MGTLPSKRNPYHAFFLITLVVKENRFYVIAISAVAALGGFLFGFDSGVINGTVDALNRAFHTSNLGSGFNVASILLGCAVGAFIAGALSDKWGRRAVLIVAAILFVWGSWGSGSHAARWSSSPIE